MTTVQEQSLCVVVLVLCSLALAYIGGAPRALKRLVWASAAVSLTMLVLCLTACTSSPAKSPLVQVTDWPALSARPNPAHCSGFAVFGAEGVRVLSAAHCFQQHEIGDRVPIVTRDRWVHTSQGVRWASLVAADLASDVAVLLPSGEALAELDPYPLAGRDPVPGEAVRLVSGYYWTEVEATVAGLYLADVEGMPAEERWLADATIAPGWSGSAVLDAQGRVLGVVVACQAQRVRDGVRCRPGFAVFEAVRQ